MNLKFQFVIIFSTQPHAQERCAHIKFMNLQQKMFFFYISILAFLNFFESYRPNDKDSHHQKKLLNQQCSQIGQSIILQKNQLLSVLSLL